MKINYDQDVDILRILLTDAAIEESDEIETGVILTTIVKVMLLVLRF